VFVNAAFNLLCVYFLLGVTSGGLKFVFLPKYDLFPAEYWLLAGLLALLLWVVSRFLPKSVQLAPNPRFFLVGFVLLLFSDVVSRRFGFYPDATVRSDLLMVGVLCLLGSFGLARKSGHRERLPLVSWPVLLLLQLGLVVLFLLYCNGRLLFSDDHPSFLYRLQLLRDHFPFIPFYNADWNAGYSAREFFPSGVLNVFFLSLPFVYGFLGAVTFESLHVYSYLIPYLFILLVPWSVYLAARLLPWERDK